MDKDINLVTMAVIVQLLWQLTYLELEKSTQKMCLVKNTSTPLYSNLRPYNLFLVS
jgi:hypothetical protein